MVDNRITQIYENSQIGVDKSELFDIAKNIDTTSFKNEFLGSRNYWT